MPADPTSAPAPSAAPGRPRPARPWLLMYHSVAERTEDPYGVTVSPARLDRQLRWLRRRGLRGVGVGELLRERAAGRGARLVGLTFDDGYADFIGEAVPLLRRHGCTATVFVLPGRLGGGNEWDPLGPRKPLLTETGIRAAVGAGMEIGSHGMLHIELTGIGDEALRRETEGSRRLLEELTGRPVPGFCYPYGTVDRRVARAVRAAGYGYACAIDPGPLTGTYALPRVHVGEADTAWRLHVKRLLHPLRRRPVPGPAAAPAAGGFRTGLTGAGR
ncbi:polysaccharide deacetylase family protein [Streptomyces sp. TRM 70361]|uniref:polysaccharide deacetylase family protein n=1 Tax=Streptomyces sp. TRM 70361 TaxID=3116553 RepID=UPI002E7BF357|nr:polysaccharide deacetylase family protein [Streptomyces sp. TRM 70361]MEE1942955.1 polysaccharide deacetylase family protein [Streptomyces sp. TRM 70361]